ncbi:hypothetical protein [uncultured Enorma sp.]|uniref:hypothetical protein n=1 Tax=uncultured Enorma sp. TaxID=1714346 RepID=UPI002591E918|nr:hypothetical protein [uncultured Enorma sp.]
MSTEHAHAMVRAPRRIGLVSLPANAPAAALVLDDFRAALIAYARLSSTGSQAAAHPPLLRIDASRKDERNVGDGEDAVHPAAALATCDTVVAAYAPGDAAPRMPTAQELGAALAQLAARGHLMPGTRIYGIACAARSDGADGVHTLDDAARACAQESLAWCGGIVVTDAGLIPRLMRAPRLGMWRRPVSRAIDRLVAAVRMGCALDELDTLLGVDPAHASGDAITVASPHPLWRAAASRLPR